MWQRVNERMLDLSMKVVSAKGKIDGELLFARLCHLAHAPNRTDGAEDALPAARRRAERAARDSARRERVQYASKLYYAKKTALRKEELTVYLPFR